MHTSASIYANAGKRLGRAVPQRSLPPCGGGTGRGVQQAQRLFPIRYRTNAAPRFLIFRNLSAETASRTVPCRHPLPVPPPQGGREPCGTHLRNSSAAKL